MSGAACFFDGEPSAARFFRINDFSDDSATPIDIAFTAPCELVMEQLTAHWDAIAITSEEITLIKDSVVGPDYDTVLRAIDPSTGGENVQDIVCVIPFRFTKGDIVTIDYPNTDDNRVGVEIMLRQVV
jgi:hypothetical protein